MKFASLAILALIALTSSVRAVDSIPISHYTYSINNGPTEYAIYVDADFGYQYSTMEDSTSNPMKLALYSSKSFVGSDNCYSEYMWYECSDYESCTSYPSNTQSVTYPYFVHKGYELDTSISAGDFGVDEVTQVNNCQDSPNDDGMTYGYLGLGFDSYYFQSYDQFSVYMDETGTQGQLIFGNDWFKINHRSGSQNTFSSYNEDNQPWYSYLYFGGQQYISSTNTNVSNMTAKNLTGYEYNQRLIFDINQEYTLVPNDMFNFIIDTLEEQYDISCSQDSETVTYQCDFYGLDFSEEDITFEVEDWIDWNSITLQQSDIFSYNQTNYAYNLLILPTTPFRSNYGAYVTPNYEQCIFLGRNYFKNYYTVFSLNSDDGQTYDIDIFVADHSFLNSASAFFMTIFGFVLLLVIGCCCCCKYCFKKKQYNASKPFNPQAVNNNNYANLNNESQDPSVPVNYVYNPGSPQYGNNVVAGGIQYPQNNLPQQQNYNPPQNVNIPVQQNNNYQYQPQQPQGGAAPQQDMNQYFQQYQQQTQFQQNYQPQNAKDIR